MNYKTIAPMMLLILFIGCNSDSDSDSDLNLNEDYKELLEPEENTPEIIYDTAKTTNSSRHRNNTPPANKTQTKSNDID
jgi:hypothetical protein